MSDRMRSFLASPALFAASALLFAFFVGSVLPAEAAKAAAYTPPGAAFDTSFFYTPSEAFGKAAAYGVEGRLAYIAARWSFDLVWPLVYGLFALAAWAFGLERLGAAERIGRGLGAAPHRVLLWIPVLGPVFDYLENAAATVLMASAPARPLVWGLVASAATPLKWLFVLAGIGGALVMPGVVFIRSVLRRARNR